VDEKTHRLYWDGEEVVVRMKRECTQRLLISAARVGAQIWHRRVLINRVGWPASLASAVPSTAAEKRTSREVRVGPIADMVFAEVATLAAVRFCDPSAAL
jgi:hypothetical protein